MFLQDRLDQQQQEQRRSPQAARGVARCKADAAVAKFLQSNKLAKIAAPWRKPGRYSAPGKRSRDEHVALSERMHRAKMARTVARATQAHAEDLRRVFNHDRIFCKVGMSVQQAQKGRALVLAFGRGTGRRQQFSFHQMVPAFWRSSSAIPGHISN